MIVQEQDLERLTQCPIMVAELSKVDECAHKLTAWVLRQSFDGKLVGSPQDILHNIRGKVLELWDKVNKEDRISCDAGTLARTAAFRIFNLVLDYEVIHLEQPYNLILSGYTIQGRYALLRKRKGECLPYVLILHSSEPSIRKEHALPPDIASMSRYLHILTNTEHKDAQLIHYPVFKGKLWFNKYIDTILATDYLKNILKLSEMNPKYPSVGEHCTKCITKPCLQIFKEGNHG